MAKKATRTSILTDQKYLGREPEYNGEVLSQSQLIKALNWYNHFKTSDDAKEYIIEYCKNKKLKVAISGHKTNTFGWLARIVNKGGNLDDNTYSKLNSYVAELKNRKVLVKNEDPAEEDVSTSRVGQWLPDFEEAIDNFKNKFDTYVYIRSHNIPQMYVKEISDKYQRLLDELEIARAKSDEQVNEAYRGYSRTDLKALTEFVRSIVDDCAKFLGNVKKERKPRKKKVKSTEALLKYFKYQQHDDKLKLSSDDPSKIIGSSAVYVLNTKYKTLTMFIAKDATGLTVNRTAIDNYDEKQSVTKRVGRKLEDVVKQITEGTKRSRPKVLDAIKADPIRFTDRLNENSLILKVDR